jgi:CRISPR-associated endonuclease/helicase Cas3
MDIKYAHSIPGDKSKQTWEPLSDHLSEVGELAAYFAREVGLDQIAKIMGYLHDIGKQSEEYQAYINSPVTKAKGPDHSSAGAKEALKLYGQFLGKMMAYGIAGHHSGLTNGNCGQAGLAGRSLTARLHAENEVSDYRGWEKNTPTLPSMEDVKNNIKVPMPNDICHGFNVYFLIRFLFSCLVDADFLATETFYAKADGRSPPTRGDVLSEKHLKQFENHANSRIVVESELNTIRNNILKHANTKAEMEPGVFTMTVPTGGGKTLTTMSFALRHARKWGHKRIIYVIPYTSIIEQTAQVFKGIFDEGDILEHHSSFDWGNKISDDEGCEGLEKLKRDTENWDSPIVVTTSVQFFETLFSSKTSKSRRLHNIANSVIIIDEAQSIPVNLMLPCMAALNELALNYKASVVLCTATQPALRKMDKSLPEGNLGKAGDIGFSIGHERELAPEPDQLYEKLKRVETVRKETPQTDNEIAKRFSQVNQMLCIVNTRTHARELFERISNLEGAYHLTTLMFARHRRKVLAEIKQRLKNGLPVRLVSTSLIEAGVDIDFEEVWRCEAGLDSIAQAAGRCNREGLIAEKGKFVIFKAEGRKTPFGIRAFSESADLALNYSLKTNHDPLGLGTVKKYFQELYFNRGHDNLDKGHLDSRDYHILKNIKATSLDISFPFSGISKAFRFIRSEMRDIIITKDPKINEIMNVAILSEKPIFGLSRQFQQNSISVRESVYQDLLSKGVIGHLRPDIYGDRYAILMQSNHDMYDDKLGLMI